MFKYAKVALMICSFCFFCQVECLVTDTLYKIEKNHLRSKSKPNQMSFKGKYKVWTYFKLITHTESRGTIIYLDVHFAGFHLNR